MNYHQTKNKCTKSHVAPCESLYCKLTIIEELMTINDMILLKLNRTKYITAILYSDVDELSKVFNSSMKPAIDLILQNITTINTIEILATSVLTPPDTAAGIYSKYFKIRDLKTSAHQIQLASVSSFDIHRFHQNLTFHITLSLTILESDLFYCSQTLCCPSLF